MVTFRASLARGNITHACLPQHDGLPVCDEP